MSREFVRLTLGFEGERYLRNCLSGGLTLARSVENKMRHLQDNIYALVPAGTPMDRALRFEVGGLSMQPSTRQRPGRELIDNAAGTTALANILMDHLIRVKNSIAIFEDRVAHPGDTSLQFKQTRIAIYGSREVYSIVKAVEATSLNLVRAIHESRSVPRHLCFVCHVPEADMQKPWGDRLMLSDDDLVSLAKETVLVAGGAYDGEGSVIWEGMRGEGGTGLL